MADYVTSKARYAKGKFAVRTADNKSGMKSRADRLLGALGGRYSHRERSYIVSPSGVRDFEVLYARGWDAPLWGEGVISPTDGLCYSVRSIRAQLRREAMAEKKVVARGRQYGLKHRERLLQQLARGIQEYEKEHPKTPIANLVAEIGEPGSEDGRMFSIGQMLENIANDLYWDDQSNWSEASVLKVGVY